jgi:hypothetical protein
MRFTVVIALLSLGAMGLAGLGGLSGCLGVYEPAGPHSSNMNGSSGSGQPSSGSQPHASTVDAGGLEPAPPPASTAAEELVKFGNCMQLADWTATGMNDMQNQVTIGEGGECYSCHQSGMYNVALTHDANRNFNLMHTLPWLLKLAQATTATDGTFQDITPTERIRDRGSEAGHPVYTLSATRQQALDNFFTATYAHYKAGNCSAPAPAPVADGGV